MATSHTIVLRTADVTETIAAVTKIYCSHQMKLPCRYRGLSSTLKVVQRGVQPVVGLRHATPVSVDAGMFPNLMLMQTCIDGTGTIRQGNASAVCRLSGSHCESLRDALFGAGVGTAGLMPAE